VENNLDKFQTLVSDVKYADLFLFQSYSSSMMDESHINPKHLSASVISSVISSATDHVFMFHCLVTCFLDTLLLCCWEFISIVFP